MHRGEVNAGSRGIETDDGVSILGKHPVAEADLVHLQFSSSREDFGGLLEDLLSHGAGVVRGARTHEADAGDHFPARSLLHVDTRGEHDPVHHGFHGSRVGQESGRLDQRNVNPGLPRQLGRLNAGGKDQRVEFVIARRGSDSSQHAVADIQG